jgi:hypothetical protein
MERITKIALTLFGASLFIVGLLLVQVFRYEYITTMQDKLPPLTIRMDKLSGKACFIPLMNQGEDVAEKYLAIEQCG